MLCFRWSAVALWMVSLTFGCVDETSALIENDVGATCEGALIQCGSECIDTTADLAHCGGCDQACAAGEVCESGECTLFCGVGLSRCEGSCRDLQTDRAHCGGCGVSCAAGEVCSDGQCALSCGGELNDCEGSCRDLQTDRAHCGGCGVSCAAGEVCSDGQCALSCGGELNDCEGSCRDLQTDRAHCGGCGVSCAAGEVCSDGQCALSCGGELNDCEGSCRDLQTDRAHCGGCGVSCAAGEVCSEGLCALSCGGELNDCEGSCRDLQTDRAHCGGCGVSCAAGEVCSGGLCTASCGVGFTACDNRCVDVAVNAAHCGACGHDCGDNVLRGPDGAPLAGVSCQAGVCQCEAGWHGPRCDQTQCGDGFIRAAERCDDGNLVAGDGCDGVCEVEDLWACDQSEPSVCDGIRGDGEIRGSEACDDGVDLARNSPVDGDGCSADGRVEFGYVCAGSPSVCATQCGDGLTAGLEECDDGNERNDDGCSDTCRTLDALACTVACDALGTENSGLANSEIKLTASDGGDQSGYGLDVAIYGTTVIVGAMLDDSSGEESGAVYVYERHWGGEWAETKLTPSDGAAAGRFGSSVGVEGDRWAIGATGDDLRGALYLFELQPDGVWAETKMTASDGAAGDRFGASVALLNEVVLVGAPGRDDVGAAYIFERQPDGVWSETQLRSSDGLGGALFGDSVALAADVALVGAPGADGRAGAAYLYERQPDGQWMETTLTPSDAQAGDAFGADVALSEDAAVVGAPRSDARGEDSGAAYLFERQGEGWVETQIVAPDGDGGDYLGSSVAFTGADVVVAASGDDELGALSGSFYRFERSAGNAAFTGKFNASDGGASAHFGTSVAASGGTVLVGASGDDADPELVGAAYVYPGVSQCYTQGESKGTCFCRSGAAGADCTDRPDVGDGFIQGAEECDDQNVEAGDGCSPMGRVEPHYRCVGQPSVCTPVCGDGVVVGVETCDDGGQIAGDGCSIRCIVEVGFACAGEPSQCDTVMGDGVIRGDEVCDDGNLVHRDGCSPVGRVENGYLCDGEPSVCELLNAESCADFNAAAQGWGDGVYPIDPDGDGPLERFDVYCDMTSDGGGWTRVINANSAEISASDPPDFRYTSAVWSEGYGAVEEATHISPAWFNTPAFTEVKWVEDGASYRMGLEGVGHLADYSTAGAIGGWGDNTTIKFNVNGGCSFGNCGGRVFRQWHTQRCNTGNGSSYWGLGLGAIRSCQSQFGTLYYEASYVTTSLWIR